MDIRKVNLARAFASIDEAWSPRRAATVHQVDIKLAKFQGRFQWHQHAQQDELFLVIAGQLEMQFRRSADGPVEVEQLSPGEMILIPRGTLHCPSSRSPECQVLLIEPQSTVNTGDGPESALTVREVPELNHLPGPGAE